MGFLSKVWKGIKSGFKKVGKAIKSGIKSVGKFFNKLGVVGQVAMFFILPGIGEFLAASFNGAAGWMAGYQGLGQTAINATGEFLKAAGTRVSGLYSSITKGVKNVIGETATNIASSLGVDPTSKTGKFLSSLNVNVVEPGTAEWGSVFDAAAQGLEKTIESTGQLFTGVPEPTTPVASSITPDKDTTSILEEPKKKGQPVSFSGSTPVERINQKPLKDMSLEELVDKLKVETNSLKQEQLKKELDFKATGFWERQRKAVVNKITEFKEDVVSGEFIGDQVDAFVSLDADRLVGTTAQNALNKAFDLYPDTNVYGGNKIVVPDIAGSLLSTTTPEPSDNIAFVDSSYNSLVNSGYLYGDASYLWEQNQANNVYATSFNQRIGA